MNWTRLLFLQPFNNQQALRTVSGVRIEALRASRI